MDGRGEEPVTLASLAGHLAGHLAGRLATRPGRLMVALAGPPAVGKSQAAVTLAGQLGAAGHPAAILPMDGYHFDDAVLEARGLRERKGAPETFDVAGLAHMLERLGRNDEPEIAVPVFDRALEVARAGARLIPSTTEVVIVEGNYLLLDWDPWLRLAPFFNVTVRLEAGRSLLRRRLVARWADAGLPTAEIARRVEENDLPNGRLVLAESRVADFVIESEG
ncbi:MAG: hypothetical protein AAFV86_02715 [Pseudomonadota bacterium]